MDRKQLQPEQKQKQEQLPPLVRDAIALMEAEFAYLYGIDELADRLEVSKHHLIRVFSANTGISPGNYLIGIRMSHARFLLQSCKDTPMEIIAGACGYSCGNYFSKVFKKHTGTTPTEYMRSVRENGLSADLSSAESAESADQSAEESIEKIYL